jgi:hypothetical protein
MQPRDFGHFGAGNEFADQPWGIVHLSPWGTVDLNHDCLRSWHCSSMDIDLCPSAPDESSSIADHSCADHSTDLGAVCSCLLVRGQIDACPRRNCGGRPSPNLEATIGLEFYGLDWSNHSWRYLVVRNAAGEIQQGMSAFDWAHWPRTSIYLLVTDGSPHWGRPMMTTSLTQKGVPSIAFGTKHVPIPGLISERSISRTES